MYSPVEIPFGCAGLALLCDCSVWLCWGMLLLHAAGQRYERRFTVHYFTNLVHIVSQQMFSIAYCTNRLAHSSDGCAAPRCVARP
jgi:hypothetical protein